MSRTLPPHHPHAPLTLADLNGPLAPWLPAGATSLVQALGAPAALALLNGCPGALIPNVPKSPGSNAHGAVRWAALTDLVGEQAMQRLAQSHGGGVLSVPNCHALRTERRNRYLRAEFDRLTARPPVGCGLSKNRAVEALVMALAPITYRQVEQILDKPSAAPVVQGALF